MCRFSVGKASSLVFSPDLSMLFVHGAKILISRAEYAVRMERTWMHSAAWNS